MTFSKAVKSASCLFVPAGRTQHFQTTLPASAKSLADERDRKRGQNPADVALNDLNKDIQNLVVEGKRAKWQSAVDKCDHRTGRSHLWPLVKGQSGKQLAQQGRPVRCQDLPRPLDDCQLIRPPPIRLTGDKSKRQLKRQFHHVSSAGTPSFTTADTKEALRLAKSSTAIGQTGREPYTSRSSLNVPSTISLTYSICQFQLDRYLKYGTKR